MKLFTTIGIYDVFTNGNKFRVMCQQRFVNDVTTMSEIMTTINSDMREQMKKQLAC